MPAAQVQAWIEESGLLTSAIALTNTQQIGMVRDTLTEFSFSQSKTGPFFLPVVAETFDGWLNGMRSPHLTREHIWEAMQTAKSGPVDEGNVGGGTGMICHDFKGGIGTSSRVVSLGKDQYTVAALVAAETMTGADGHIAYALPLDELARIMASYRLS